MIVLGVILLLIGYFAGISILYTLGGILVVVGVVLWSALPPPNVKPFTE